LILCTCAGFKKKSSDEEDSEEYSYDDDTDYCSRSKATISVSTKDRRYQEKMESYRSGIPSDTPAPIPPRPANLITRELNNIGAAVSQIGGGIASRFKFGNRRLDKSQTSDEKHEAYARGKSSGSMPVQNGIDESESIVDPTKVLDDDHIKAEDRIKDFERRMKYMMTSTNQNKPTEDDYDQSTMSSRPEVPINIKFAAAQLENKNSSSTGKGSSDDSSSSRSSSSGSSSSDSSAPMKKRKKRVANKKNSSNAANKVNKKSGRMT
jgi:hypothetical protein